MTDPAPTSPPSAPSPPTPRWQPIAAIPRRVLGVLVEKAKTTPENYPLSLNALRSGCNQKNNRAPLMQLEEEQVEEALDQLRHLGAITLVQGSGRVDKYRHGAYDWLGVDKVELAVMAELLLRGAQTIGELRGRAARMEPIKGLSELQPILDVLQSKGLLLYLTPPGRGCVVTHTLYREQELDKLRQEYAAGAPASEPARPRSSSAGEDVTSLHDEIRHLREQLAALKQEFTTMQADVEATSTELRRDLDELNRQLGG